MLAHAVTRGDVANLHAHELTGGMKQRVAMAIAISMKPKVIIADEPTSALDAESEALVIEGLRKLMLGRTTLMVAHRMTTIREVGRILVLNEGRIAEIGTPAELLARGGYFAKVSLGKE